MTKDEILSMAKAAGFPEWWLNPPEIERKNDEALNLLLRFAALVAERVREDCARVAQSTVCDTHIPTGVKIYGTAAAKAIRERK
jgi:hypothetical protein